MYCSNCGKEIDNHVDFCPFCGEKLNNEKTNGSNPMYSYQANIGFDNGKLNVYEDHIHFVSGKSKDISLPFEEIITANVSIGVINLYTIKNRRVNINLPKGAAAEVLPYIQEQIVSKSTFCSENGVGLKPVFSYQANIGFDNGRLDIYETHICFVSGKGKNISLRFEAIQKADVVVGGIAFYTNENKTISIGLPKNTAKELFPYIQEKLSSVPESVKSKNLFDKIFGTYDKICVNDDSGDFLIQYARNEQSPTYHLKDIVSYEIKEINKEGDTLSGALMGGYIAGRSGAVLGAQLASGKSDVTEVQCRIMVENEKGASVLLAKIAVPFFAVSQTSKKYSAIKAEEMKLDSFLKKIVNSNNQKISNTINTSGTMNTIDDIRKFKELLDEGIITEEEFNAKKKQILGI